MPQSRATLATPTVHSWADKVTASAAAEEAGSDGSAVSAGPGPEEPCRTPCRRPPMTKHDAANAELGPGVYHGRAAASLRLDPATAVDHSPSKKPQSNFL